MSFALSFKTLTLGSLLSFLLNFANSFSSGLLHPNDPYSARTCKSNCSYTFGIFINCKQKQTEAKTRNPLHILYANICITMEVFTPWPGTASYTVANNLMHELMYVLCKTTWSGKVPVRLGHLHGNMKGIFFFIWSCQVIQSCRRTVFHECVPGVWSCFMTGFFSEIPCCLSETTLLTCVLKFHKTLASAACIFLSNSSQNNVKMSLTTCITCLLVINKMTSKKKFNPAIS